MGSKGHNRYGEGAREGIVDEGYIIGRGTESREQGTVNQENGTGRREWGAGQLTWDGGREKRTGMGDRGKRSGTGNEDSGNGRGVRWAVISGRRIGAGVMGYEERKTGREQNTGSRLLAW